jgi:putative RecB family exonuclease
MKPEYLSASRIQQFLMCPKKYQLQYVDKVDWDFTPSNLVLGSAVHAAIECYYRSWVGESKLSSGDMIDLFNSFWDSQVEGKTLESGIDTKKIKQLGQQLVDTFIKNVQPANVLAVEEQFTVPVIDRETGEFIIDLKGVYDLVEEDDLGSLVIADNKTAAKRPSDNDLSMNLQLSCYGYAARQLFNLDAKPCLMRLDIMLKTKVPAFDQRFTVRTPSTDSKLIVLVRDIVHAMSRDAFFPIPGWGCAGCQVKSHCPVSE